MLAYGDALLAHGTSMMAVAGASAGNAAGTFASWQGAGAASAAVANIGLNAQMLALAEVAMAKAQIAHAAAAVHAATVARMVTHVEATANRTHEAADEAINPWVLGALTPEIAVLNLEYFGFMWPNNAAAGVGYGAALDGFGAALMAPAPPVLSGASPAAAASAAGAIAQTAVVDGAGAAMRAAEQGATAVMAPAAAGGLLGGAPPAAPPSSAGAEQLMTAIEHAAAAPAQPMAPTRTPAMGMFAPPGAAASVTAAPAVLNSVAADAPVAQILTPRPPVTPSTPAPSGVTSFVPPAKPFSPPPPTAGRAAGLRPGMLNAAALRGPVATIPMTGTAASALATATQPLAYFPPEPPQPTPPSPPQPPLFNVGETAHTLNPPPQPTSPQQPPLPASQPAAPPSGPPPGLSTGTGGSDGSGGPGTQMLGSVPGQAPQAPPVPMPLDPRPPVPPPQPGDPPLRSPSPPSWAHPPVPQSVQEAQNELKNLERLIQQHNSHPPNPFNSVAVESYNSEAAYYNAWAAQLHGKLDSWNTQYTPASPAKTANTPSWTQPAPQQPTHQGPPKATETTPRLVDEVPLQTDLGQIERKYKHAADFGVTEPRGRTGFDNFYKALKQVVDDPATMHIQGTFRGQPAILNYNSNSGLCVIQTPDGRFISGWELDPEQVENVVNRGILGGD
jgi:hypothetical protein